MRCPIIKFNHLSALCWGGGARAAHLVDKRDYNLSYTMSGAGGAGDDFLEDYYDVVVLSTGLGSSILAA